MSSPVAQGELRILNAGAGDLRITFRPDETPEERAKIAATIRDMLRRGYALLVENADGTYSRAVDFDPEARAYVVAGLPDPEASHGEEAPTEEPKRAKKAPRRKPQRRKVAADKARAVAVGRSAGG